MPARTSLKETGRWLAELLEEKPGPRPAARHGLFLLAAWGLCHLLLLVLRPGYPLPPYRYLDSWFYTSYHWDLRNQLNEFGPVYYATRLSWNLPGALCHALLPPVAANLCLKLAVSALFTAGCTYPVLARLGLRAGFFAVVLAVFSPQIIGCLHADYTDTAVLLYAALVLACITAAHESRRWAWWILLAGFSFGGMTAANLSTVTGVGVGLALFHLLWLRWSLSRQLVCVGLYLAGIATVLAGLGYANTALGGEFLFLRPQLEMIFHIKALTHNPMTPPSWHWMLGATWLVLPVAALLLGCYRSFLRKPADEAVRRMIIALTAGLAAPFAVATYLEIRGFGVQSLYYYASLHLCFALPLLALCCAPAAGDPAPSRLWFWIAVLGLIAFVFWGGPLGDTAWLSSFLPRRAIEAIPLALAALLLISAAWFARRPAAPGRRAGFLRVEILVAGLAICSMPVSFRWPETFDRLTERYLAVHAAYHTLAEKLPRGSYRFWFRADESNGMALAATKLWAYRLFSLKSFPEFEAGDLAALTGKTTVVVPCLPQEGTAYLALARRSLAARRISMLAPRVIVVPGEAGTGFDLVCFSLREEAIEPETGPPSGTSPMRLLELTHEPTQSYAHSLEQNLYGPKRGDALDFSAGFPVFLRTSARDHLATTYQSLAGTGRPRELSLVAVMPAGNHTVCIVQADDYREIRRVDLREAGRSVHRINVPADATKLRIYFASETDGPTALPVRLALYEVTPPP